MHEGRQVERQLPNVFVPGTAKAGTSSLYVYLKQHPDIIRPNPGA